MLGWVELEKKYNSGARFVKLLIVLATWILCEVPFHLKGPKMSLHHDLNVY